MKQLAFLLVLAACNVGTTSRDDFLHEYPYGGTLALAPSTLASAIASFEAKIGGGGQIRITELSTHDEYISIEAQDPKAPTHVDSYVWQDGDVSSTPRRSSDPAQLADALFPLADVPRDLLPFARRAYEQSRAKIEDGHITTITIERAGSGESIAVSIQGPRDSTTVRLDAHSP